MSRRTKFIVYVNKEVMDSPTSLADAVISHLIEKKVDIPERKLFLAQYVKANYVSKELALKVIDEWVQVRDVETFPFRKEVVATDLTATSISMTEMAECIIPKAIPAEDIALGIAGDVAGTLAKGEQDANTAVEGDIPVDDGAPESRVAPE